MRTTFFCVASCIAAALAGASLSSNAGAQAEPRTPQLQVDPFWPKPLPNNWLLGQVSGVAVDSRDHVWIVQRPASLSERELGAAQNPPLAKCCVAAPPVLVFDQSGNLVRAWGGPGNGYEWPASEHGIFVDETDSVWLAGNGDNDSQILKFTLDGEFLLQIGRSGASRGSNDTANLGSPADISVDAAAREVYVADGYRNRRVIVFDSADGRLQAALGRVRRPAERRRRRRPTTRPRRRRGSSATPCTACGRRVTASSTFATASTIASRSSARTARSCPRRSSRRTRCSRGSVSELAFSPDAAQRFIYMVDGVNNELRVVERASNTVIARIGRPGRYAGQFHVVHNVAVDGQGNVYTTEVNTGQRVQKFRRLDPQD